MVYQKSITLNYIILFSQQKPEEIEDILGNSIFQGFSNGIIDMEWAFRLLIDMPADIYDFGLERAIRLRRRMTGNAWRWLPLYNSALANFEAPVDEPFWIIMSGDDDSARAASSWIKDQELPVLHVSNTSVDPLAIRAENADWTHVREFVRDCGRTIHGLQESFPLSSLEETLAAWREPEAYAAEIVAKMHNCTVANLLTLKNFGAVFQSEETLAPSPDNENEYIEAIKESASAVYSLREEGSPQMLMASRPFKSDLIIAAPSMFASWRQREKTKKKTDANEIDKVITILRQQTGYFFTGPGEKLGIIALPIGQMIMNMRARELRLHASVVALKAASLVAPVLRLPNGINQAADLKKFTNHVRSLTTGHGTAKTKRVFKSVQKSMQTYTDPSFYPLIERSTAVKLISDAPLEWLPVEGLTLGLAKYVSRIPNTPGNMMIMELANKQDLFFKPKAFERITVISSFAESDPLRFYVKDALELIAKDSEGRLKINFCQVKNVKEFVDAINKCQTPTLMLDLHGSHTTAPGVGTLRIGDTNLDVWSLRGQINPPPIILLSACDTHSPDRTHVTVAAGFLNCGARTVLATLLPIDGGKAAVFAARLALRAAWYTKAAIEDLGRAIDWRELVSGALRLDFVSTVLFSLIEKR